MTLHKAFDGETYYWWDDDRQQASRVRSRERKPIVTNNKEKAREVPLTNGMIALIDECDWERVSKYRWYAYQRDNTWYAYRGFWTNGKRRRVTLHRFILNLTDSKVPFIDHKNRNGLDCRRENLRPATHSQNLTNSRKPLRNTSGYKGVIRNKQIRAPWEARIRKDRKHYYLGAYETALEAALAYDRAAKRLHGEFAALNFPEVEP